MEQHKIGRNSVILMLCTLASRLLGIVKARAVATVFGASGIGDVINFTFNIPNNFRKLFAEGALSSAYIPAFTTLITRDEGKTTSSQALLARMQGFQLLTSVPLVVLTWVWREPIIGFLSDFSDPSHIELSGRLLVWFMVFLGTISFASLYGGVLQSHHAFFTAAIAPLVFSIVVIGSVYLLSDRLGAYSMAFGVVAGGTLQALVTFLRLRRLGYRARCSFRFNDPAFKRVMRSWAPVTITAVIAIVTQQVSYYFASTLSEGVVTSFSNAIILWQAPYGIFQSAIATVFFPAMVSAYHSGKKGELGALVSQGLVDIATFLIPAAIALAVLRNETTAVLLQSGRFTLADTMRTGSILLWFSVGMPLVAWYAFLQRSCYSTGRFYSTVLVGLVVSLLDIVLTYLGIAYGLEGEAMSIANTIAHAGGLAILSAIVLRIDHIAFDMRRFSLAIARLLAANLPLLVSGVLYVRFSSRLWWRQGSTWTNALVIAGLYLAAMLITAASYRIADVDFLRVLRKKARRGDTDAP
jgi:putative peptidoglycan lipid II flippase